MTHSMVGATTANTVIADLDNVTVGEPVVQASVDGDVIPDGDFAGMRANDVLEMTVAGIHDAIGECSIEHALASLDMALSEALLVAKFHKGDEFAYQAALNFCKSCVPYFDREFIEEKTYTQLLDLSRKVKE